MSSELTVLAFSGSARRDSFNLKLLRVVAAETRAAGAQVTEISLREPPLPIYDGDLEETDGLPEAATRLIRLITEHDALLIASPEYNSYFTPLLKNAIDWCTRGDDNPFEGKVAAVVSASPGMLGGVRSMTHVRQLLTHLGAHVVPAQCILPHADKAFNDAGRLVAERSQKAAHAVAVGLVDLARRLKRE